MNKTTNLIIRVTDEEKTKIKDRAQKLGLKTSEFIRVMSLEKEPILIDNEERRILKNLSINFNQMVRLMNAEKSTKNASMDLQIEILKILKNAYRRNT